MLHIYVDADACPVKDEIYRVARRCQLHVTLVANAHLRTPPGDWVTLHRVEAAIDEADDWIAEQVQPADIVITADIPLAARCVAKGAAALSPKGRVFTETSMGEALATRDLLTDLRDQGLVTGGPPPFSARDRSTFLQRLDDVIQRLRRNKPPR